MTDYIQNIWVWIKSFILIRVILELRFLYSRSSFIFEQIGDKKKYSSVKKHRLSWKRKRHKKTQKVILWDCIREYL